MKSITGIAQNVQEYPMEGQACASITLQQKVWNPQTKAWDTPTSNVWFYGDQAQKLLARRFLIGKWVLLTADEKDGYLYGAALPTSWGIVQIPASVRESTENDRAAFSGICNKARNEGYIQTDKELSPSKPWELEKAVSEISGSSETEKAFRAAARKLFRPTRFAYIGPVGSIGEKNGNVKISVGLKKKDDTVWCDVHFWGRDGVLTDEEKYILEKVSKGDTVVLADLSAHPDYAGRKQFTGGKKPRVLAKKEVNA